MREECVDGCAEGKCRLRYRETGDWKVARTRRLESLRYDVEPGYWKVARMRRLESLRYGYTFPISWARSSTVQLPRVACR